MLIRHADADFTQLREAWHDDVILGNGFEELSDIYQLNRLTQQGLISAVAIGEVPRNPGLNTRLCIGAELKQPRIATFYMPNPAPWARVSYSRSVLAEPARNLR
jgi:N-ethylmaleimide reductase